MTTKTVGRICLACHRVISGRADKKFCNSSCRNTYNNRINRDASPLVRTINNALRKNRRILQETLAGRTKPCMISKDKLQGKGFRFRYFTHTYTNLKGETYHFCYDYGYRSLEDDSSKVLIVREIKELAEKA
jgi:hypothetical protein